MFTLSKVAIGLVGKLGRFKIPEMRFAAIEKALCAVGLTWDTFACSNTPKAGLIILLRSGVERILLLSSNSQIRPPIVERVSIDVICNSPVTLGKAEDHSVHIERFNLSFHDPLTADSIMPRLHGVRHRFPCESRKQFAICGINKRKKPFSEVDAHCFHVPIMQETERLFNRSRFQY